MTDRVKSLAVQRWRTGHDSKRNNSAGGIGLDHKPRGKISASLDNFYGRNYQRYNVNVTPEESTGD